MTHDTRATAIAWVLISTACMVAAAQREGPLRPPPTRPASTEATSWDDLRKFCTGLPETRPENEPPARMEYVELLEETLDAINRVSPYAPEITFRAEEDDALKLLQRARRRAETSKECAAAVPLRSLFAYQGTRRLEIRAGVGAKPGEGEELIKRAEEAVADLRKAARARRQ